MMRVWAGSVNRICKIAPRAAMRAVYWSSDLNFESRAAYTTGSSGGYAEVAAKIDEGKFVIVSATYCPFCS